MATTLTGIDTTDRITLNATAGKTTAITLPANARSYEISSPGTDAIKIAITGTDGGNLGTSYETVNGGTVPFRRTAPGTKGNMRARTAPVIYVAGAANSQVIEITPRQYYL